MTDDSHRATTGRQSKERQGTTDHDSASSDDLNLYRLSIKQAQRLGRKPLKEPKCEMFAFLLASGLSRTQAFTEAGLAVQSSKPSTVRARASRWAKRPDISARVEYLRRKMLRDVERRREKWGLTRELCIARAHMAFELAYRQGNALQMNQATRILAGIGGYFKDAKGPSVIIIDERLDVYEYETDSERPSGGDGAGFH